MRRSQARAARLEAALADLEALHLDGLRARWRMVNASAAPPTLRAGLLRAALAYKLQENALGGLRPATRALLRRIAGQADPGKLPGPVEADGSLPSGTEPMVVSTGQTSGGIAGPAPKVVRRQPALRIKPGTRLLRTWQGHTHEVLVGQGEVTYRGQRYRSLSEVARAITGQRWSGPLFFGLKGRATADAGKAAEQSAGQPTARGVR